jgi:transposase-like protein
MIKHAEEVTGNVAMTCRYYGISRTAYYRWLALWMGGLVLRLVETGVLGLHQT